VLPAASVQKKKKKLIRLNFTPINVSRSRRVWVWKKTKQNSRSGWRKPGRARAPLRCSSSHCRLVLFFASSSFIYFTLKCLEMHLGIRRKRSFFLFCFSLCISNLAGPILGEALDPSLSLLTRLRISNQKISITPQAKSSSSPIQDVMCFLFSCFARKSNRNIYTYTRCSSDEKPKKIPLISFEFFALVAHPLRPPTCSMPNIITSQISWTLFLATLYDDGGRSVVSYEYVNPTDTNICHPPYSGARSEDLIHTYPAPVILRLVLRITR
jgi:hypothetical protein